MSTWICDPRPILAGTAAFLLAGCFEGLGLGGRAEAPTLVRVAGGSVAIAGPPGYCIDPVGTRDEASGSFVLLGSCAALNGGDGAAHPQRPAALAATVAPEPGGPRVADTLEELAALFTEPAGRAMLSRTGDPGSVAVLETRAHEDMLLLRLRDASPFAAAEVTQEYWRAVLDIGDRMVMLSVIPLDFAPMDMDAAEALLQAFAARVREANGEDAAQQPAPLRGPIRQAVRFDGAGYAG